jgi:inner membrane protein
MLIAHLPAGYITARAAGAQSGPVFWAALLGSVFPDFDMIWFLFTDQGSIHHYKYWVHAPGFWAFVAAVTLPFLKGIQRAAAIWFLIAILVHLVLDSIGGGIMWLWPLSDHLFTLIEVPATQSHWVLSFILHWTFVAEVAVIGFAVWLYLQRKSVS